jgi:hypothetical protein
MQKPALSVLSRRAAALSYCGMDLKAGRSARPLTGIVIFHRPATRTWRLGPVLGDPTFVKDDLPSHDPSLVHRAAAAAILVQTTG